MAYREDEYIHSTGQQGNGYHRAIDFLTGKNGYVDELSGNFVPDKDKNNYNQSASQTQNAAYNPVFDESCAYLTSYYRAEAEQHRSKNSGSSNGGSLFTKLAKAAAGFAANKAQEMKEQQHDLYLEAIDKYGNGDYEEAFGIFDSLFKKHFYDTDPSLFCNIGICYFCGNGVQQDQDYGYRLFMEGYDRKDKASTFFLGRIYFEGGYMPVDYEKAWRFFCEAEQLGFDTDIINSWKAKFAAQ